MSNLYRVTEFLFGLCVLLLPFSSFAQCSNNNVFWADLTPPSCPGNNYTSCIFGGEYATVNVTSGNVYVFQTCGDTDFDTEVTLYNNSSGAYIAFNDDGCGLQSTVTWTATFTGTIRVLVDKSPCTDQATCMTLSVTCSSGGTPSYNHNTTGLQNTFLGACMVNTCSANYYDNGGSVSNYSSNINQVYRTFCPSQPGNCLKVTFTSFNINDVGCFSGCPVSNCYDALFVKNGPTQNSTDLWAGCGTTIPGPFTSTDPSGCLTFRFSSDASVTYSGWAATLTCVACAGGPTAVNDYDCVNANTLCGTSPVITASDGPGLASECSGCAISENFSHWFEIYIATGGSLNITIDPVASLDDFDFSLWGPNVSCGNIPVTNPVRCSYAANTGNTGLGNSATDYSEDVLGNGWVAPLTVTAGQTYYLLVNQWSPGDSGFVVSWSGTAILGAPANIVTVQTTDTCSLLNNGSACVVVNAGLSPYTYSWSTGAMGVSCVTGLNPGNYTVTLTDATGCNSVATGTVGNLGAAAITFSKTDNSCFGDCNGTINSDILWGYPPFSWSWCCSLGNDTSLSGICAGTYSLTITDSAGCTAVDNITITQPSALSHSFIYYNAGCNADSLWKIDLTVTGGTSPYTYSWTDSNLISLGTSQDVDSLTTGIYFVTVTDAKGCSFNDSLSVSNPLVFQTDSSIVTHVKCYGGSTGIIDFTVSGGITPYTYQWSTGTTTENLNSIPTDTFTVIAWDRSGCQVADTFIITQPPPLISSLVTTPVLCAADTTGSADLTVSGGVPPYTYSWTNGATTEDISGLTGISYIVTIRDTNNCLLKDTAVIGILDPISITKTTTNVSCNGGVNGSISVTVTGGNGTLTYAWSNGNTTSVANNLAAGTYIVTVSDTNSCTAVSSTTVTQPIVLSVTLSKTNVGCYGACTGSASTSVTGGTSPYSYSWSGGGTTYNKTSLCAGAYTVTVTDSKGCTVTGTTTITQPAVLSPVTSVNNILCYGLCNGTASVTVSGGVSPYTYSWSGGGTTSNKTSLCAGTYTVTVTDWNYCTATATASVTQPAALNLSITGTDATCSGSCDGSATATAGGGVTPYTHLWSNGQSQSLATSLCTGSYAVTVSDGNNCTITGNIVISTPLPIILTVTTSAETCGQIDGSAEAAASGGSGALTYLWNTGSDSTIISGLTAGTYFITVYDSSGCFASDSAVVTGTSSMNITLVADDPSCSGSPDGDVTVTVTSGTSPYTFLWNTGSTGSQITGLLAGTFSVTATDQNGCTDFQTAALTEPPPLTLFVTSTDATACGGSNGTVTTATAGGSGSYTYLWSNGSSTASLSGLAAGTYTVIVSDANGCAKTASAIINGYAGNLAIAASTTDVTCPGDNDGSAVVTGTAGLPPYSYQWSNGFIGSSINNLSAGNYTVTVTDGANCVAVDTVTIASPQPITISFTVNSQPACGSSTGSVTADVTGGTPPYEYIWANNDTVATADGLAAGNHFVIVTDNNGCIIYGSASLSNNAGPSVSFTGSDASCHGASDGSIDLTISGGNPPYSFNWSDGSVLEDRTGLSTGMYTVIVNDNDSCVATTSIEITEPAALVIAVIKQDASCGIPDGSASVQASGSTPPYAVLWSIGSTAMSITGLDAGIYSVAVSDSNGCMATGFVTIAINNIGGPVIQIISVIDIGCGSGVTGAVDIEVSGGSGSYTYQWSNGATTEDISGLPAGLYYITITDSLGCKGVVFAEISKSNPAVQPLCIVTVDSTSGRNLVIWDKTLATPDITQFNIYKEGSFTGIYNIIGSVSFSQSNEYLDLSSDPDQRSWRYKITAVDTCGNESDFSEVHKTMHLAINLGLGNKINLIWDPYEGFTYNTQIIYRGTDPGQLDSINAIPSTLSSYNDNTPPQNVMVYYAVAAVHPNGCTVLQKVKKYNASKSNTALQQVPVGIEEIQVAGYAFRIYPNPNSGTFTIECQRLDAKCQMSDVSIYNVFGQKVFSAQGGSAPGGQSSTINRQSIIVISGLSSGLYFIQVTDDGERIGMGKVVVE